MALSQGSKVEAIVGVSGGFEAVTGNQGWHLALLPPVLVYGTGRGQWFSRDEPRPPEEQWVKWTPGIKSILRDRLEVVEGLGFGGSQPLTTNCLF
jgi:hypothetical protein